MLRYNGYTKIKVTDIFVPCYAGEHFSGIDNADIQHMKKMIVVLKTLVGKISTTHVFIVIFNTVRLHNINKSTCALFTRNLLFGHLTVAYISFLSVPNDAQLPTFHNKI